MSRAIGLTAAFMLVTYGLFGLSIGAWASEADIQPDAEAR